MTGELTTTRVSLAEQFPASLQAIILPWILLGLLLTAAIALFVVGSYRASAREVKVRPSEAQA